MTDSLASTAWQPYEHDGPPWREVRRLGPAEQLVLWALRQRLADGIEASPMLVRGFRLAFGLGRLEAALAAFEALFSGLSRDARADIGLSLLRCGRVSMDEARLLALFGAAQLDDSAVVERLAPTFVGPAAAPGLARDLRLFARLMRQVGLEPVVPGEVARTAPALVH
jgi:hypothetical protein